MKPLSIWIHNWKLRAAALKKEIYALLLAYRDPRVSLPAKAFAGLVVAYAFSPVDLIPDFIPILGYLDDLVLIPLGVSLAVRMIPAAVLDEKRLQAEVVIDRDPQAGHWVAILIIAIWVAISTGLLYGAFKFFASR